MTTFRVTWVPPRRVFPEHADYSDRGEAEAALALHRGYDPDARLTELHDSTEGDPK